jgi:Domain of unknown function (DUF4160)
VSARAVSAFYGIVIRMCVKDHPPPHFHALYGEYRARVAIASGETIDGELPRRAARLVREWAALHRGELEANWERAQRMEPVEPIEPLP